ncbi:MAG: ribose-5-phosphate isomerase RpiA [Longimicrobiales bacterium]|nr:ribose-5-phosphate isomerase RpiA [Longimicrobiales bacterium]
MTDRSPPDADALKRRAAAEALTRVESGMRLGLGTGSTMAHFLDLLGDALEDGAVAKVAGVATSERTAEHARRRGIPTSPLAELGRLDLAIDGADEVDPALDLVKGLGGALLREKMIVQAADRFIVIADQSKEVSRLCTRAPLPVEVVPFAWDAHLGPLAELGGRAELRKTGGDPYMTDNGNFILDIHFDDGLHAPDEVDRFLQARAGVVESGLFLGVADEVFVASPGGTTVRVRGDA